MATRDHLYSVVASLQPVIYGVSPMEMDKPTPCDEFDVRTVANHMLGTIEAMRRVGAAEPLDPEDPWGTNGQNIREQWRDDLGHKLTAFADAWSQPDAWEGDAMDGAVPRQLIGDMGYVEVMLHGWDLARGTGQDLDYTDEAGERALEILEVIGEQGRSQGAFGPEVEVPDDAPAFAKALGKSGRDPEWTP
ncbi:MAG: TIGR03086 family metal-binding protein [Marmoricola sp.]